MAGKGQKIIKMRRSVRFNPVFFIFVLFFIYLCFMGYSYISRDKVSYYEVVAGQIVQDNTHTGVIVRSESVQFAPNSGYVNFYTSSGNRVGKGEEVYSLDETGGLTRYLENNSLNEVSLSDDNIRSIKKKLSSFSSSFTDRSMKTLYDTGAYLNSAIMEYAGLNTMENLDQLLSGSGIVYTRMYAPETGVISFDVDNYCGLTAEELTSSYFDRAQNTNMHIKSGQLVEQGTPVYKIVNSENWQLLFLMTDEERARYSDASSLKVELGSSGISVTAPFSMVNASDGSVIGRLEFSKYMVDFIDDRIIDFEIDNTSMAGLKIPKTSVVNKAFYIVPADYLTRGGDGIEQGFMKEYYENGSEARYTPANIYYQTDEYVYLDPGNGTFEQGDYLIKPDSDERYKISETAALNGVYNINKGYTIFKMINIIDQNDEFYIVKKNQNYGLAVYDHILFNPEGINEGDFLYQ